MSSDTVPAPCKVLGPELQHFLQELALPEYRGSLALKLNGIIKLLEGFQ